MIVAALAASLWGPAASPRTAVAGEPRAAVRPATYLPNPYSIDMPASLVLGQSSFTADTSATSQSGLAGPDDVAFGPAGQVWVLDRGNNRVLEFLPPFTSDMDASVVIGQGSFTTGSSGVTASTLEDPSGIAVGPNGALWVADLGNNRVLEFVPPFTSGMAASVVLGQSSFTTSTPGTTATNLSYPFGLAFSAAGDLFVADYSNNRVLEFVPPFSSGMGATLVLGQSTFTSGSPATSSTGLDAPLGLAFDASGDLFVGDAYNERVVEYRAPLSTGMAASLVLGQSSFTSSSTGTTATTMDDPTFVAVDPHGDLWVADAENNRQLEFRPPFANGMAASMVLGQPSFTVSSIGTSSTSLSFPIGMNVAPDGNVWVADESNNRVLEFVPTTFLALFLESGLSNHTNWSVTFGGVTQWSTGTSIAVSAENGTYAWSPGSVGGYSLAPASGVTTVNGSSVTVVVAYTPTSSPSLFWPLVTGVLGVVVIVDTAVLVSLVARGRRAAARPPPQPVPPASPPPGAEGPAPPAG